MRASILCAPLLLVAFFSNEGNADYAPTWDSLDTRPLPGWYDDAKIGIFVVWGVFSVPSFGSEWFWYYWAQNQPEYVKFMEDNYPPNWTYQDFASQFKAELFDPSQWAKIFQKSGAKYVVLTSKHHEGFTMWPSNNSWNWNAMDLGPKRDLIQELSQAVRKEKLTFGLYHSLLEWFNPLFLEDTRNNCTTQHYVDTKPMPELYDIVDRYKPEVIWSDGDWGCNDTYWRSRDFIAWLYNKSPVKDTVVVNDRWGDGVLCKHGDFLTCQDRFNPGKLQPKKWENAMTIDKSSWGFNRISDLSSYLSEKELLLTLVQTVAYGGNILINVGPTADGRIEPIFEERLLQLGDWLEVNGDAIYKTKPWIIQNDTITHDVYYTQSKESSDGAVYATFFDWPVNGTLRVAPKYPFGTKPQVFLLSSLDKQVPIDATYDSGVLVASLGRPDISYSKRVAWVLKFINL